MHRAWCAAAAGFLLTAATAIPARPALADSIRDQQWFLTTLKVSQAHAISTGAGIIVGLVDTGVDPHRDLKRNLLPGFSEVSGKADGRTDTAGHGTNMAGLIVAHGRGSAGVLGIAPAAKLLPIRAAKDGKITGAETAKGIDYSVAHKAQVISVSLAAAPAFELLQAVDNASSANVVIVAGVGNGGSTLLGYPAAVPGVLAVGSTDRNGKHSSFSNTGGNIQICAPGESIVTTAPGNQYDKVVGSSAATAIVSGAVALVRAKFPQLSAAEVIHRITATADDIGPPGRDDECGYGELNIVKALTADVPPLGGASTSASPSASDTAGLPTAAATSDDAAPPTTEHKSSSAPLIIGVVVVVLLVGALVGLVAARRRRS
jgi:type VII secretion-associated serine protease mycosin